jgi:hypothetical protein
MHPSGGPGNRGWMIDIDILYADDTHGQEAIARDLRTGT